MPLNRNLAPMLPRVRHLIRELHTEKMVHIPAESLFEAQRHFGRDGSLQNPEPFQLTLEA